MKIVAVDNFDKDLIPDRLVAENVADFYVESIVKFLNSTFSGNTAPVFFMAKPDDYQLRTFEP
jgi:hypothetical protein